MHYISKQLVQPLSHDKTCEHSGFLYRKFGLKKYEQQRLFYGRQTGYFYHNFTAYYNILTIFSIDVISFVGQSNESKMCAEISFSCNTRPTFQNVTKKKVPILRQHFSLETFGKLMCLLLNINLNVHC